MEWFKDLDLNEKQQALYMHVLEKGAKTASELATELREQRTNIYLIAEELEELGLVQRDQSQPVVRFTAANPTRLQQLMREKQKKLASTVTELNKNIPELVALYHLNNEDQGMAYFEGLKGYTAALEDMIRTKKEVCVFAASNVSRARPDAWNVLQRKLDERARNKVKTKLLFEKGLDETRQRERRKKQKIEVRHWGKAPFDGEVAIYGATVVLTTYDEKLISLVIKNAAIAATLQSIFDTAWNAAQSVE